MAETASELYGDVAWVRTKEQVIEEGWLGGVPSAAVAARLGDVVLVPFVPMAFLDPADTGELRLKARHGSLTRRRCWSRCSAGPPGEAGGAGGNVWDPAEQDGRRVSAARPTGSNGRHHEPTTRMT